MTPFVLTDCKHGKERLDYLYSLVCRETAVVIPDNLDFDRLSFRAFRPLLSVAAPVDAAAPLDGPRASAAAVEAAAGAGAGATAAEGAVAQAQRAAAERATGKHRRCKTCSKKLTKKGGGRWRCPKNCR